ncbi:MAG: hypothetical protein ACYTXA_32930 [Nostoc sp.]
MDIQGNKGVVQDPDTKKFAQQEIALKRSNQLALSTMTNPSLAPQAFGLFIDL